MDKYEYKLRADEIVRLAGKKYYKAAAKIADEVRWEKVKNIQMLCTVSEVYEKIGRYEDSKEVLLLAYNRSPNGKMIVYRLVNLSIALKDYQEATEFYHEYMQLAPNDSNALILKYKLYKGKGAALDTLISILEEFKTRDYQEEWILELAKLYHQADDRERCVELCNEIDLWFNKGTSVIQALEIKKLYEPLTPMQEKKLQNREEYIDDEPEPVVQEQQDSVEKVKKPISQTLEEVLANVEKKKEEAVEEKEQIPKESKEFKEIEKIKPEKTEKKEKKEKKEEKESDRAVQKEELPQKQETEEKQAGILEKVFSKLMMEDDELEDDFNDDYVDDETEAKEDGMVARGLTGQYEKVVIEEEEDWTDPLDVRMNPVQSAKEEAEEEEYEYIYADEDEYEEYEDIEEEDEARPENKRFKFFRNTLEDDMYDEEKETENEQEVVIPLSYAAKYDTLNLQKELAKSIQQLMDATEKETVDSTLENVKKMVEESHIPKLTETMRFRAIRGSMLNNFAKKQAQKLDEAKDIEKVVLDNATNAAFEKQAIPMEDATVMKADARPKPAAELAIKLKPSDELEMQPLDQLLTVEDDGQISLLIPEEPEVEEQVAGQLTMEDVLREWEKQELLSENDKEKRALEEARKRALEETQEIMFEIMGLLKDVIPKIGSIKDGEEKMSLLAVSLEKIQKSLPFTQGIVEAAEESKEAASAIEAACAEAVLELESMENGEHEEVAEADALNEEIAGADTLNEEVVAADLLREEVAAADTFHEDDWEEDDLFKSDPQDIFKELEQSLKVEDEEYQRERIALRQMFEKHRLEANGIEDAEEESEKEEISTELMPPLDEEEADIPNKKLATASKYETVQQSKQDNGLNEEQKGILSYFLAIDSLKPVLQDIVKRTEYAPEHMIITGEEGSGKTSVAMRIIKASQINKEDKIDTIAKIKATLLNQKEVEKILEKVNGGVLIIEKAGSMKPSTIYALEDALYSNRYYVQIIFVDKKKSMIKLLNSTGSFMNDIQMRIDLPIYTNNELVEFAKQYALENGYELDDMAVLALHSEIEIFQTDKHNANLEDVKNIMDGAMERADKRSKKLFGKLFGKNKSENVILIEGDFE